jgi:hypothetical protein
MSENEPAVQLQGEAVVRVHALRLGLGDAARSEQRRRHRRQQEFAHPLPPYGP